MDDQAWKLAGEIAFYAFTAACLLFMLLYGFLSPWWRTATGRNIMFLMTMLAVAATYFTLAYLNGTRPPASYPVRFAIFLGLFLAVAWRVVLFVREQVFARRARPSNERTTR